MNPARDIAFQPPDGPPVISPVAHAVLERMLEHFFPDAVLAPAAATAPDALLDMAVVGDGSVAFNWYGMRYTVERHRRFSVMERLLLQTIIEVAAERLLGDQGPRPADAHARGSLEDRCAATFIASSIVAGAA